MKTFLSLSLLFLVWAVRADEAPVLTVKTDRSNALYKKGEEAVFSIRLDQGGKPLPGKEVRWTIKKNGLTAVAGGTAALTDGTATVTAKLEEPGFLLCEVELPAESEPIKGLGGAAFDPQDIKPSKVAPKDFDAFWKDQLAKLAAVPKNFTVTPVPSPVEGLETFDVQGDAVGKPVSGYYAKPAGAAQGSLPALLTLHGAGVRSARLDGATMWARRGMLALDINAHGLPNGKPDSFYKELADGELKDYRSRGRTNRENIYFLGMFQRVIRALDFLTSQPEWDGRTLVVYGTSQGGAQALAGAALDDRVTFFVAGVPAMCDHSGRLAGRDPGWPKFVPESASEDSSVHTAVGYYDMVNFASRIKVPGFLTVGYIDTTCPPATVYAAYNQLGGEKKIYDDIAAGHTNTPEAQRLLQKAVLDHVASQKKP